MNCPGTGMPVEGRKIQGCEGFEGLILHFQTKSEG